jgi:hypothetical protein
MSEQSLTLRSQHLPTESEFHVFQTVARNAAASGLYAGVGNEQKILMVLLAARELNVPPLMALNGGLWNIQGKIEISARLLNSMIRKAGHSIIMKHCDSTKCVLEGKRIDNGDIFISQFTEEEAKRAGLMARSNWKNFTEDMLFARALSRLARRLFPDVIGIAYVEGEIRDAVKEKADIETIKVEVEDPIEIENKLNEFLQEFPEEEREMMREYLKQYASHWKKSKIQTIADYEDKRKFHIDFTKWKSKEIKKRSND